MLELNKVENGMFNEYYEGTAVDGWKVICILDKMCVRYIVFDEQGKTKKRRIFKDYQTAHCYKLATEELNRI